SAQAEKESLVTAALSVKEKQQLNALLRRLMLEFEKREAKKWLPPRPRTRRELVALVYFAGGISTRLTTWMTPFVAITSAFTTFALFTKTVELATWMRTFLQCSVLPECGFTTSAAVTLPETTW